MGSNTVTAKVLHLVLIWAGANKLASYEGGEVLCRKQCGAAQQGTAISPISLGGLGEPGFVLDAVQRESPKLDLVCKHSIVGTVGVRGRSGIHSRHKKMPPPQGKYRAQGHAIGSQGGITSKLLLPS